MMDNDRFNIRRMRREDIGIAVDWAAAEGWNPGLHDAECFALADPQGFLIGEIDGEPAATISNVNYDDRFSFLGFYIVRRDLRGRGYGLRIWQTALAYAGRRTVGLDGVVAQQSNYRKSGFVLAYRNIRYGGVVTASAGVPPGIADLREASFAAIEADDARVFPASRRAFLRAWINAPGHVGRALIGDGGLKAWGVIRPCRKGFKIGPLVAGSRGDGEAVFTALAGAAGGGEIFLDVPEVNREAIALADNHDLRPVFQTARMYNGSIRPVRIDRLYGVATFELG